jgi:hypothetical protein
MGRTVYRKSWRYAGDYLDGAAVVQADDGRSTHIDVDGHPLHGRWFIDLGVLAKDSRGLAMTQGGPM